jgi:hypothetical protein
MTVEPEKVKRRNIVDKANALGYSIMADGFVTAGITVYSLHRMFGEAEYRSTHLDALERFLDGVHDRRIGKAS